MSLSSFTLQLFLRSIIVPFSVDYVFGFNNGTVRTIHFPGYSRLSQLLQVWCREGRANRIFGRRWKTTFVYTNTLRNVNWEFHANLWYRRKYRRKEVDLYAALLSRKLLSMILAFDARLYATDLRYLIFRSESKSFCAAICISLA